MTTLAQELPREIKRLEKKFGSDNPFVNMLKRQLEDINSQKGEITEQTWQTQALKKPNTVSEQNQMYDLQNLPFDPVEMAIREAFGIDWDEDISKETIKRKSKQIADKLLADKIANSQPKRKSK
jgi:hypothetical protein